MMGKQMLDESLEGLYVMHVRRELLRSIDKLDIDRYNYAVGIIDEELEKLEPKGKNGKE